MRNQNAMKVLTAALLLALVQACGDPTTDPGQATSTSHGPTSTTSRFPKPTARITTTTIPPVTGEVPQDMLEPVLEDAAGRADVAVGDLEVIRSQAMVWPDGALGCPRPGEAYIQVIIPGYWVEITGPGGPYDYRLDDRGNFRICDRTLPFGSRGGTVTTLGGDSSD